MITLFWSLLAVIIYGYVGYGLLIIALGRVRPSHPPIEPPKPLKVTILIAAHNEAGRIGPKIDNCLSLRTGGHDIGIVVVSDGSADGTADEVRSRVNSRVSLIEVHEHVGKCAAINAALPRIDADVVVFSDANSRLASDALLQLLKHFGDPKVGGVCGRLQVPARDRGWWGLAESVYWAYDSALKAAESRLAGAVSAQGSLYAVRAALVSPVPPAVADDLYISLGVVAKGRRLVFEPAAITEEPVTERAGREFGRRVRSTERGWRGLLMMTRLLNPFRYGFYSVQLFSHKVLRRLLALVLPVFFIVSLMLANAGTFYAAVACLQIVFYGLALLLWAQPRLRRLPGSSLPLFFVLGHAAMVQGLWNVVIGRHSHRWAPVRET